uniref:Endo/exonuclease/phosphatase domain-containing protein n=1 Tax=Parastrongyloides trichosuri TaxID=131310 RepID=A0A0N4ZD43_PARTI
MTNSLNEFLVSSDNDQELILLGPGNIKIPDKRELDKITELGKIKVMCYTWNVAERNQGSINAIIHSFSSIDIDDRPNIISIALQELPPSDKTFHINLVKQLTEAFKTTHYILSWVRRWSQMQIVIVKNNLKNFILSFSYKWIPSKYVSKPIRTKGCITIFIKILHLSCAFISCHFSRMLIIF